MNSDSQHAPPRLLIRADANPQIGAGHVMRTLALAQAWQEAGGEVEYLACSMLDGLHRRLERSGIPVRTLIESSGSQRDALALNHHLQSLSNECPSRATLVIDGYQFGSEFFSALDTISTQLLVIDDGGRTGAKRVDWLLDAGFEASADSYPQLDPRATLLLGPRYSLIRSEFVKHSQARRPRDGSIARILVSLGGSDPFHSLPTILTALRELQDETLRFRIIAPVDVTSLLSLRQSVAADGRFEVLEFGDAIADHFAWADLAVAAGGGSNHEMALFGLPRIIITLADNQAANAREFVRLGAASSLGHASELMTSLVKAEVERLLSEPQTVAAMAQAAWQANDGLGARRVVELLMKGSSEVLSLGDRKTLPETLALEHAAIQLRPATLDDAAILFEWRNDPISRAASRSTDELDFDRHCQWLRTSLPNPNRQLYVALLGDTPVGTVRVDHLPHETTTGNAPASDAAPHQSRTVAVVSWTVAPEARGQGVGTRMVAALIERTPGTLRAEIRESNVASQKIAQANGFHRISGDGQWLVYERTP